MASKSECHNIHVQHPGSSHVETVIHTSLLDTAIRKKVNFMFVSPCIANLC